jgi:DNA invertase Pin-like site-specific DNA recombinase
VLAKPTGKLIGYARVSTKDQKLRMQLDELERIGCHNIWQEHASASKGRKRPELENALIDLRPGDTLVVWKLDRLTRSLRELFQILDRVHAAGAGFFSITEQIDLSTPTGRLLLGVFGAFAQFAAELTAERTARGIKALQDRGFMYGRERMLSEVQHARLVRDRKRGLSYPELGRKYDVSTATARNYCMRSKRKPRLKR